MFLSYHETFNGLKQWIWNDCINLLNPNGYSIYHQFEHWQCLVSDQCVFLCLVLISEQTVIISIYSINWFNFITKTESDFCVVQNGSANKKRLNCILKGLTEPEILSCVSVKYTAWMLRLLSMKLTHSI